jgi:hypothetical protein
MALLEALREAPWPLREKWKLSVSVTTFSSFFRALVGTDGEPSRSGATTADRYSDESDNPHPSL